MTPDERTLKRGDVVQLGPSAGPVFAYTFMTVLTPKRWGAIGFVKTLNGKTGNDLTHTKVKFADMAYIGTAEWMPQEEL